MFYFLLFYLEIKTESVPVTKDMIIRKSNLNMLRKRYVSYVQSMGNIGKSQVSIFVDMAVRYVVEVRG